MQSGGGWLLRRGHGHLPSPLDSWQEPPPPGGDESGKNSDAQPGTAAHRQQALASPFGQPRAGPWTIPLVPYPVLMLTEEAV